jgi:ankyrin repeat protein
MNNSLAHARLGISQWLACLSLGVGACMSSALQAQESLADLIQQGRREAAIAAIRDGVDVNATQGDGTSALHWAVYKVDGELVDMLLSRGASPDVFNRYGSSPLVEAIKVADTTLVDKLIEAGSDIEAPNADGQTALMLAARVGARDIAERLIAAGADVNAREAWRGQTAVMWAADARAPEVVALLIEHGADVEIRADANDWRAQITSEPRGQYRPTGGLTPLLYAARSGCVECVASILDAGAAIDRPNPDGVTPLMIALDNFNFDAADLLLERGANPHVWDWWGRTALYIAVDMNSYSTRGRGDRMPSRVTGLEIIDKLLATGVNPNPQLNMHRPGRGGNSGRFVDDLLTTGATPLLRAAIAHDVEAVERLLAHGALVDLPNVMGVTPLMGAAGVGVSARDRRHDFSGDVEARSIATLDLLLAGGADVNARIVEQYSRTARIARPSTMTEREGQTALYGAIKWGWRSVVEYLLAHGAAVDVTDAYGKSPIDAATGNVGGRDNTVSTEIADLLRTASGA